MLVGRDSSVGLATCFGLDAPGSSPGGERDFPHPSRPALEPIQPPIQLVPGHFREGKVARGVTLTTHPPYSAEVIERVELRVYLYSPSGPSWPVIG